VRKGKEERKNRMKNISRECWRKKVRKYKKLIKKAKSDRTLDK